MQIDKGRLESFIQRIERLNEEKANITADIKEVYSEAGSSGFDVKIMRKIVAERKKSTEDRQEEQTLLDLYRNALGMLADTPLGESALKSVA